VILHTLAMLQGARLRQYGTLTVLINATRSSARRARAA
jgi:hypothetical protein